MTRVNVVPVSELHPKHLVAEYREIVRVFALVRNRLVKGPINKSIIPPKYVLGAGHVTFFFDKLQFVLDRYHQLINEMLKRGYNPNPITDNFLVEGIENTFFGDYEPTAEALALNRQRILDRMPKGK